MKVINYVSANALAISLLLLCGVTFADTKVKGAADGKTHQVSSSKVEKAHSGHLSSATQTKEGRSDHQDAKLSIAPPFVFPVWNLIKVKRPISAFGLWDWAAGFLMGQEAGKSQASHVTDTEKKTELSND